MPDVFGVDSLPSATIDAMPAAKKSAAKKAPASRKKAPRKLDELDELYWLRTELREHLTDPSKQKLGIGTIAAELRRVVERIAELEAATNEEAPSLADQLAQARQRRTDGDVRTSRRGIKSAR